jgi:uncharacterized short protein YbdD (DUF466 family)
MQGRPIDLPAASPLDRFASALGRVLGAPDYEGYLAHMRARHPEREPLSREEFGRDALARRYDRPGSRCC